MLRLLSGGLRRSLSMAASRPPWALIQLTSMDKSGAPAAGASFHLDEPLRRSLSTASSRPPWAMVNTEVALDASGAPSPRARASFDLNAAPRASQLSVPARFVDPREGTVRGASCDGLLLLDFLDTRHCRPRSLEELAADGGFQRRDVRIFVCNPLSGQLFRLPAPDMHVLRMNSATAFGLLTQSEGSHGPPDRYVVAQLSSGREGRVVRRFLSETGQWEQRPVVVAGPLTMQPDRRMLIDHEILAFGDRLWWVDVTWGVCSVDPFSDRPEPRFVQLPDCSVLHPPCVGGLAGSPIESRYRRMGVSEGKLRFVHLDLSKTPKSFLITSFSLDVESCSWTLDHGIEFQIAETSPDKSKPLEYCRPGIAAIDPFKANVLYLQHRGVVIAMDMAKGEEIWRSRLPEKIASQMTRHSSLFLPCVLPSWLASSYIPGTFSSNKTNCERKTLAEMLVRVDSSHKN